PQGAVVTDFRCSFYDTAVADTLAGTFATLYGQSPDFASTQLIASVTGMATSGTSGFHDFAATFINSPTIDNDTFGYAVTLNWQFDGSSTAVNPLTFNGCK